jgi:hypothetical protein
MMFKRAEVVENLKRVMPALADTSLIPVQCMLWFTGKRVMAYNDQIAISVPFKSDFQGAVSRTLLDLVVKSRAHHLELEPVNEGDADWLHVNAASLKGRTPLHPPDSFVFQMPEPTNKTIDLKATDLLPALELCMRTVAKYAPEPDAKDDSKPDSDWLGVTLLPNGSHLDLYSANGPMITKASVRYSGKRHLDRRVTLNRLFCEKTSELFKPTERLNLEIGDEYAMVRERGGDWLWGRLIESAEPLDFLRVVAMTFSEKQAAGLVWIPALLKLIIERALVITDAPKDASPTEIWVENGHMTFTSERVGRGMVQDVMRVPPNHPPVIATFNIRHFLRAEGFEKFLITDRCAVFTRDKSTLFIAARG